MPRSPTLFTQQLEVEQGWLGSGRFDCLSEDDAISFNNINVMIGEAVQYSVSKHVEEEIETSKETKQGKSKKDEGDAKPEHGQQACEREKIGEAVIEVVMTLQPLVVDAIASVVITMFQKMKEDLQNERGYLQAVNKVSLLQRYESDKLDQYQRRDVLRFAGIPEPDKEDENSLENSILKISGDMDIELAPDDISVAHRITLPGHPAHHGPGVKNVLS